MPSPRLDALAVRNYRSVGSPGVRLTLPKHGPLVLLGENNAGKSNVVAGAEILFGDRWPGSWTPEDHDYYEREPDGMAILVAAKVSGIECDKCPAGVPVHQVRLDYDTQSEGAANAFTRVAECSHTYMTNVLRQQLFCMLVGADRRLSYQMSYTSKYTYLSRLMRRFHESLTNDADRVLRLKRIFELLLDEFTAVEEFAAFRALLATASDDFGQNLAYGLDVDFSAYDPSNFFRSLKVHPRLHGEARAFDELGTGQEQILALAFAYAYAKAFGDRSGLVLVIDEPESHLHPLAQRWLAGRLNDMTGDGLQVILTTHSPHFVDLARPENLVVVRKPAGTGTTATQLSREAIVRKLIDSGADPLRTTEDAVGPYYAANATAEVLTGLFSRLCVIVEGPTEAMALPELLAQVGFDALREGVAFIGAGGLSAIARWRRLMEVYGVPVVVIHDTDSNLSGSRARSSTRAREDLMAALGRPDPGASAAAMSRDPLWVDDDHATFDPDFEQGMLRMLGTAWQDQVDAAADLVGESKPLQARAAAREVDLDQVDPGGVEMLQALADVLRARLG